MTTLQNIANQILFEMLDKIRENTGNPAKLQCEGFYAMLEFYKERRHIDDDDYRSFSRLLRHELERLQFSI